jgi:hypothetical protein
MTIPEDQVTTLLRKLDEMKELQSEHIAKSVAFAT